MTCVVCGKRRPDLARQHRDPYCSTACAREANGCPLPESEQQRKMRLAKERQK